MSLADAMVSVLVIVGLLLARAFGWLWMDPLAGIIGAVVIASWAYGLVRDTGAILLDMTPDRAMAETPASRDRGGWRPADGPASLAARARASRRYRFGGDGAPARAGATTTACWRASARVSHLTVEVRQAT